MRSLLKNKRGGFTDIFLFLIFGFIIALIIGVFIYLGGRASDQLHDTMDEMDIGTDDTNVSDVIDDTFGQVNVALASLRWLGVLIIFGMIFGMFIGSYMVTTKPVFFIPFIFLQIIGIVVSVAIANAYETLIATELLASTFATMGGINWIMLKLPIIATIIGFASGTIMFARMGKREEQIYGYQ